MVAALAAGLGQTPAQTTFDYAGATAYVRQGQAELAIPILEKMLAAAPYDLKARNLLGIALLNTGRKAEASVQFKQALQTDPKFQPALKNLAVNEMAMGLQSDAKSHFEQLLKAAPNDPVAHLYLGEISFAGHRYARAIAHYEQSDGLYLKDPQVVIHNARSHFEVGVTLAKAKNYVASAQQFQLAQKGFPDPYQVRFNLTLAYVNAHNYAAAIEAGESLARDFPKGELYNLLSRAYEGNGRTQAAYDALRTATQVDPGNETNYLDLMALCLTHENWDLSLEISDVALSRVAPTYRLRLQRGAVLAMKGLLEDAENEFLIAAREAPQVSFPSVALAVVWLEMKKPEQAVEVLRVRRAQDSKDYLVNWFLAEALNQAGVSPGTPDEKEAVAALQDAVRSNPTAAGPRVLLGKMLVKRGQADDARRQFEEAMKLDPNDASAAYHLALIYRKAGNTRRAEELMAKVGKATSVPDSPPATGRNLVKIVREGSR
jgi:Flp pilus assembly protein TadD